MGNETVYEFAWSIPLAAQLTVHQQAYEATGKLLFWSEASVDAYKAKWLAACDLLGLPNPLQYCYVWKREVRS